MTERVRKRERASNSERGDIGREEGESVSNSVIPM
jgi:hypothetical protein